MSLFSRLFGSRAGASRKLASGRDVEAALAELEREAAHAVPGYVGTAFNRAGDLALRHQQAERAMSYYGRAIDAFLVDGQREAARGVANKIIRVRPEAVRTLGTLTWLDLAARHQAMAVRHVRDYAEAARAAGEQARAATQIHAMARVTDSVEVLEAAAHALELLDFPNRAREVRSWKEQGAPGAISSEEELASACAKAAVRSNDPGAPLLSDRIGDESSRIEDEGPAG